MSWAIRQTRRFLRTYKRLHTNQLLEVNQAIEAVAENPLLGEPKKGDL
ncbi:MAG: type II toxin-antitoxin system RelE/ParE family toxin, partial [Aquiluna sp.]